MTEELIYRKNLQRNTIYYPIYSSEQFPECIGRGIPIESRLHDVDFTGKDSMLVEADVYSWLAIWKRIHGKAHHKHFPLYWMCLNPSEYR